LAGHEDEKKVKITAIQEVLRHCGDWTPRVTKSKSSAIKRSNKSTDETSVEVNTSLNDTLDILPSEPAIQEMSVDDGRVNCSIYSDGTVISVTESDL
jgi:hypothetical protein